MICSRKDLRRLRMSINKGQNSSQYSKCHPVWTLISRMDGHAGGWGMHELRHCVTPCHFSLEIRAFRRAPPMSRSPSLKQRRQINSLAQSAMVHPLTAILLPQRWKKGHESHGPEYQVGGPDKSHSWVLPFTGEELEVQRGQGVAGPRPTAPVAADLEHHFHLKVQSVPFTSSWYCSHETSRRQMILRCWGILRGLFSSFFFLTLRSHLFIWDK